MQEFENFLKKNLIKSTSFHPHYEKSLNEMLLAGGKRFRPQLLLAVVKAYEPMLLENAYYPALAIEMLHTYSLIHDDLPAMDDANLRRGFPTLHATYDQVTAILAGDALNTYAFELLSYAPLSSDSKVSLIKELSSNGGANGMVLGQAIDCHFEKTTISLEELKFLHIHKTGKLIAASLKMGAIVANLDLETQKRLYNFGIDLGLLFQIQDDIIDETKTSEEAGKDTKNDSDKNSFVNLLGLEGALRDADELAEKLENELNNFDTNLKIELEEFLKKKYLYRHKD
jgi:farnesyl diphosphate synthase